MSRRHAAQKRAVTPDARYNDPILGKFINCLMWEGKKSTAESIVYSVFDRLATKKGTENGAADPRALFHDALSRVRPKVEVKSRRIGGATYPVPIEVRAERAQALSIRWLIQAARKRNEKTMEDCLAAEILDASQGRGAAVKKREDGEKMADANRMYSHYQAGRARSE